MKKFVRIIMLLLASLFIASTAYASNTILIDFESLPGADGVLGTADDVPTANQYLNPLREEYAAVGLHFSQGTLFQSAFYDGNPANHFISSTNPIGTFSVPVYGISIDSYSSWNATLTAYDRLGNVLATNVLQNPKQGYEALFGNMSVSTSIPIYSFSVLPEVSNYILNLDNLTLTVSAVPEPHQYLLLALGLTMVAGAARRERRRT